MNASNSPPPSATKQDSFESFATTSGTVIDDSITGRCKRKRSKLPQLTAPRPKWKKPDPTLTAAKITRPCTECGKRFWSWKALFGHMRCHPERQWRGINPPPNFQTAATTASTAVAAPSLSPSSSPLKPGLTEEDCEVAISLMMMARGWVQAAPAGAIVCVEEPLEVEPLNCQIECSSCKRVFGSHQALGGHRATHKNVKGKEGEDDEEKNGQLDCSGMGVAATTAVGQGEGQQECSICLKIFSSGKGLGGQKRWQWERGERCCSSTKGYGMDLGLNMATPTDEEGLLLDLRLGI